MSAMTPSLVILLGVTFICPHYSYAQTTVVGPSDTVYVNPGESASFNCSVTQWRTGSLPSIYFGRSRDDGSAWTIILHCFNEGTCNPAAGFETVYTYESNPPDYNFFKFTVTSSTLAEDAHYDCYSFEESSPAAPHGRLYVLNQVTDVSISGYNNGDTRTVDAGTEVVTTCTATSGNPPADLLWKIGDKDITSKIDNSTEETGDDTRLYDTTSSLRYAFNASDDQQYLKCQSFQHDSLTPRSSQILMDVKHAPVIQAIVVDSWEGNTVVVECDVSANPDDVTYSWVSDDGQTGGNSRTWTLTDEDGDDEVTVMCNASNVKGETSLTEIVKKPYVPTVITTTDNPYTANEGDKVELSCETDAEPPFPDGIIWEWLQQEQDSFVPVDTSCDIYEITPESGDGKETTLLICSVQIIHANTYVCKLGESAVNISVIVSGTPQDPCDWSNMLSIVFGCLFAMTLALLILTFSLLFINGHGLRVLVKKKDRKSENLPESTYQSLQRDVQQSSYTHLHIGNTNVAESPEYIDLDIESTYTSLEEDNKSKDTVYLKSGDVVREFPRSRLYLKDILCEGRFSKTMTGEAWFIGGKDGVSDVIVKVDKGDKTDFKREVEVMGSLSKLKGVVEYLGCCITEDPMYLITEYAPNGTLLQVLENMKDTDALKRKGPDLLTFALDVAECLKTLSENKIIHREIMAKNIVVDSQWKCKLSGLGSSSAVLTDQRYRQKMKGHFPTRWMAPEVLSGNAYTIGSDVWSFGVLLWEVFSLGDNPYNTIQDDDVKDHIVRGQRLEIPQGCTESIYQLMTSCWTETPSKRLNITNLVSALRRFLSEDGTMQSS